uniref:Uncharacterized protein n=1 Tax=Acrobeloides nanus TaxID=290746 RepID=A0A914CII1_9BILA
MTCKEDLILYGVLVHKKAKNGRIISNQWSLLNTFITSTKKKLDPKFKIRSQHPVRSGKLSKVGPNGLS